MIEQDRPIIRIMTPEEEQVLVREHRLSVQKEKFKAIMDAHPNQQFWYQPEDTKEPKDFFSAGAKQRAFQRAELSFKLNKIDLGWDMGFDDEFRSLLRGEIPLPVMPQAEDIDADGHQMLLRNNGQTYVCRMHEPPLIIWRKPL